MSFFLKQACTWVHSPPRRSDSTNCANSLRQFPAFFWVLKHTFLLCVSPKIAPMKPNLSISQFVHGLTHRTHLDFIEPTCRCSFFPGRTLCGRSASTPRQTRMPQCSATIAGFKRWAVRCAGRDQAGCPRCVSELRPRCVVGKSCDFSRRFQWDFFGVSTFRIPKINGVMVYMMEPPKKRWMIWGYPHFGKPPFFMGYDI